MTTGRIDYSPDYKSHAEETADRHRSFLEVTKMSVVDYAPESEASRLRRLQVVATERARLEREVVERAITRRKAEHHFDSDPWREGAGEALMDAEIAEDAAVDALIEFESLQEKKG